VSNSNLALLHRILSDPHTWAPAWPRRTAYRYTVHDVVEENRLAVAGRHSLGVLMGSKANAYFSDDGLGCAVGIALPDAVADAIVEDGFNSIKAKEIWMLQPDNQTAIDLIQMTYDTWMLQQLDGVVPDAQWWLDLANHYDLTVRGRRLLDDLPVPRSGFAEMTPDRYMAILDAIAAWDRSLED
jgi:hypothetical protein